MREKIIDFIKFFSYFLIYSFFAILHIYYYIENDKFEDIFIFFIGCYCVFTLPLFILLMFPSLVLIKKIHETPEEVNQKDMIWQFTSIDRHPILFPLIIPFEFIINILALAIVYFIGWFLPKIFFFMLPTTHGRKTFRYLPLMSYALIVVFSSIETVIVSIAFLVMR